MKELTKLTIDRLCKPWVYGRRLNVKISMYGGESGERRQRGLLYAGNVTVGMRDSVLKGAQPGRYKGRGERNIKQGNIQQQNKIRDRTDTRTIGQDIRPVIRNMT